MNGDLKMYDGNFIKGRREGPGTLIHRSGIKYTCLVVNGRKHSSGVRTTPDGDRKFIIFNQNQRN